MTLGKKLYELRKKSKISHEQFAFALDISKTAIIKWENDKSKPGIENLLKICDYYELNIYNLLEDVSNIKFQEPTIKGSSYEVFASNSNENTPNSKIYNAIIQNQKSIELILRQQSLLIEYISKNNAFNDKDLQAI